MGLRVRSRSLGLVAVAACLAAVGSACGSARGPAPQATRPGTPGTSRQPSGPGTTSPSCSNESVLAGWPVERRAAQLLAAPVLDFSPATVTAVTAEGVGGILFLGGTTPPTNLASSLAGATREPAGTPAPLVMADEEGGGVQRLVGPVSSIPWPRQVAETLTPAQAQGLATTVARQMRQLGVTADLAPVLDVDGGEGPSDRDPDGLRSFSASPTVASSYGLAYVAGLEAGGVLPVVKHFPGLGGASGNTDDGPASTPPLATLQAAGLKPFQAAISAGAPAVMVANASVPGLSAQPASLSSAVIRGLLEHTLGFSGLVLTDSLSAGAISQAGYSLPSAAVAAVAAGADMVLFGSTLDAGQVDQLSPSQVKATVSQIVTAIDGAVTAGGISPSRLDDAVAAVLRAKHVDLCAG